MKKITAGIVAKGDFIFLNESLRFVAEGFTGRPIPETVEIDYVLRPESDADVLELACKHHLFNDKWYKSVYPELTKDKISTNMQYLLKLKEAK